VDIPRFFCFSPGRKVFDWFGVGIRGLVFGLRVRSRGPVAKNLSCNLLEIQSFFSSLTQRFGGNAGNQFSNSG
jgi:hypothetical protein